MTADWNQRDRAVTEPERSFAVEASAGTGKTGTLVKRILHLVLEKGPAGPPIPVSSICAITFTEKAAGEMKVRLRQEFEKSAVAQNQRGEYAREALSQLEAASISTFHAFAVSLLKERPIEARLDPHFTTLDELQSNLFFLEVWESWLDRALTERCAPLENALRAGIRLDQVYDLANTLRKQAHIVRRLSLEPPPAPERVAGALEELRRESAQFPGLLIDPSDLLASSLALVISWLENPSASETPPGPGKGGRGAGWEGGRDTVERVKDFIRRVVQFADLRSRAPKQQIFHALACWLVDDLLSEWDARKRANGYLDFADQLEAARLLLASGNHAARSDFQKRYKTLLVDEFQDTDPVQLEIVMLLSSKNPSETEPARLRPDPGRLFIVGDPKQSIYRFRGADIETYLGTVGKSKEAASGLEHLELTTNFRSVPSILRFVDAALGKAMEKEGHYQSEYLPFGDDGARVSEPAAPSVYILGDRSEDGDLMGEGRDFHKIEAVRIARLIEQIKGSKDWKVEDSDGQHLIRRQPEYGDIAVLLPVLSRVDAIETALRAADIPYVLEGGKFYYARSEVASAISTLRAIANPCDQVALYSALRSIFFGLSDEDLLRAHVAGLPFDYREDVPPASPLCRPYSILRDLHRRRHERTASATLEGLLQQTGAREVLAARGFQSLANLAKLARQLRSLQEESTFPEVVSLLGRINEEEMAESESRLMEEHSNAVRLLTIHKAKGLDFRIVILAGAGLERGQHASSFLADAHDQKKFVLKIGSQKDGWCSPGWDRFKEEDKKREDAELLRLLYVALTRARDYLVISTHNKGTIEKKTGALKASFGKTRLSPIASFLEEQARHDGSLARFLHVRLDSVDAKAGIKRRSAGKRWGSILEREYEELDRLVTRTPLTGLFQAPAQTGEAAAVEEKAVETARTRAIRLGAAFHEAMERLDFDHPSAVPRCAKEAGVRHELDTRATQSLENMLRNCLGSSLIERCRKRARDGLKCWRELPYVRPLRAGQPESGVEEGKIDLLFEEPDGWILVDYKTDTIPDSPNGSNQSFQDKYESQIGHYVGAISALGLTVKEAWLLLARTGAEVPIRLS